MAHGKLLASLSSFLVVMVCHTNAFSQISSTVWLTIRDNAGGHDSLVFGNDQRATYCLDTVLGENASPPYPPTGFAAVFLSIPGRQNCFTTLGIIKKDLRDFPPTHRDTFQIRFQNVDSLAELPNVSATLRWPDVACLSARCDSMFIVDPSAAILPTRVDMFAQDSLILQSVYDPNGPNPTAPVYTFFIYDYGLRQIVDDCMLGPEVVTYSASHIDTASATLNGGVAGNCYSVDSVAFRFGTTTSYGNGISATQGAGATYFALVANLTPKTTYHYQIISYLKRPCGPSWIFAGGDSTFTTAFLTSAQDDLIDLPREFSLGQNYPNPFNPSTSISYSIPKQTHVRLQIFNPLGQLITTLVDQDKPPGTYTAKWDASTQPSGLYFYRLSAGELVQTKKAILIR